MKPILRQLLKSPGYTLLAVGALALGIGANTVLFSAINTLFLRPLAFPQPERLVTVYSVFADRGLAQAPFSWPRFDLFRAQQDRFTGLAGMSFIGFTLTGRGEPEQVQARRVTQNFFDVLGVPPLLGRNFTPDEDKPGGPNVVLLSHKWWQKHFNGSRDVIGQTLTLSGAPYTVIGVLPPLPFPFDQAEVWATRPIDTEGIPADLRERGTGFMNVYGRLKPGVAIPSALEQLKTIQTRYAAENTARVDIKTGISLVPLQEDLVGAQRPMFMTLLAAVGCVLLIACANVANLLLARFAARRKEIAIRAALGASRRQIVTQFLAESVLTAAIAGAIGVLLAIWGVDLLARAGADFIPRASELKLDARVLGFAVVVSLLTGLALGLVPALQASRTDANESLKDSARGSTGGKRAGKFRSALLVGEVALSLVLLVAAALLVDSFRRLQKVDPGFRSENISLVAIGLPPGQYPTLTRQAQFFQRAIEKIGALPGVTHVAAASGLPIVGNGGARSPAAAAGEKLPPLQERIVARRGTATPGFLRALDIPITRGRDFTWRDREDAPAVVMINEVLAKRLYGNEDPIGRPLITGIQSIPREIVGVFAAVKSESLAEAPIEEMFYPSMQVDGAFQTLVIRSPRPAGSLRAEVADAIHSLDPGLPVPELTAYTQALAGAVADKRLAMTLLGSFAALALVLAGMGIYSVIAYSVAQRTNEFGIRLALGAAPQQVVAMVVREGLKLAVIGLAVGLAAALALTRLMQKLLFQVSATDPVIFGGVAFFLCAVAALACLVPALRATKVDPMTALRAE